MSETILYRLVPHEEGTVLPPEHIDIGDWIDLRCAKSIVLAKGQFMIIPLGIAMKIPDGYESILAPRSSTCKKFGIIQANSIGVLDNSFAGDNDEWGMPVIAVRDTEIQFNDRICQFRIQKKQPTIKFVVVDKLGGEDRGGFGSTGTK